MQGINPSGISHSSSPCAKGKTSSLPLMLQRHNHKAYLDALQKRTGCAPRHLTQISSEGTRNPEGHFQGCCSYLRWAHSREMSWVAMTWVMHNKSVFQRVYHLNQSIFNAACEPVCSECSELKGLSVFLLNGLIYLHLNVCFPAELLNCLTFRWMHSEQRAAPLSLI